MNLYKRVAKKYALSRYKFSSNTGNYLVFLSEDSYKEFENQDHFTKAQDFIMAMSPGTRSTHCQVVKVAGDAKYFDYLTKLHLTPPNPSDKNDTDPDIDSESIFHVYDRGTLLKDQDKREDEKDWSQWQTEFNKGITDEVPSKTKYPYRDRQKSLLSKIVVAEYLLRKRPLYVTFYINSRNKIAIRMSELRDRTSDKVKERSRECVAKLKRVDAKNLRWLFDVTSPNNKYIVTMKGIPPKRKIKYVDKLDVKVSCNCNFWRWQGPDYHAKTMDYLDRKRKSDE